MIDHHVTMNEAVALAQKVGELLRRRGFMLATAESCTGGLIGHLVTETPGSSDYFAGGAVVYSYAAKERVLGVDRTLLEREGAVSAAVAQQMAQGALRLFGVEIALAVTGVAGPGGGSPEKPVGLVYLHLSTTDGVERGARFVWPGNRSSNKLFSAVAALELARDYLVGLS